MLSTASLEAFEAYTTGEQLALQGRSPVPLFTHPDRRPGSNVYPPPDSYPGGSTSGIERHVRAGPAGAVELGVVRHSGWARESGNTGASPRDHPRIRPRSAGCSAHRRIVRQAMGTGWTVEMSSSGLITAPKVGHGCRDDEYGQAGRERPHAERRGDDCAGRRGRSRPAYASVERAGQGRADGTLRRLGVGRGLPLICLHRMDVAHGCAPWARRPRPLMMPNSLAMDEDNLRSDRLSRWLS